VRALAAVLREKGLAPRYNRLVDVAVTRTGCDLLFEVKTTTAATFREQARAAVGQLLEYGFYWKRTRARDVRLIAVLEASANPMDVKAAEAFLSSVGITLVTWHDGIGGFSVNLREMICSSQPSCSGSLNKSGPSLRQDGVCDR
jgi:hypothetical protein